MIEEWRTVTEWPKYEVSSLGRVRSWNTRNGGGNGRLLEQLPNRSGYLMVHLRNCGRSKTAAVHVLVCSAFIGPKPTPYHQVAHNDGSNQNNEHSNLRWATAKENAADRDRHGNTARGERNLGAGGKLSEADILEIKALLAAGARQVDIARRFGIVQQMVSSIKTGVAWRHIDAGNYAYCFAPGTTT